MRTVEQALAEGLGLKLASQGLQPRTECEITLIARFLLFPAHGPAPHLLERAPTVLHQKTDPAGRLGLDKERLDQQIEHVKLKQIPI
jgi:hypothetical protein